MKFRTLLGLMAAVLLIGLTSCQKDDGTVTAPTSDEATLALSIPDASPCDFNDATADDAAMMMNPPDGNRPPMDQRPTPLLRILKELQLTAEQLELVKAALKARDDCHKAAMLILRQSEKEILKAAREEALVIIEKVKSGEMTREEARPLLNAINQRAREALKNNPVRARVMQMLKDCDDTFNTEMLRILDDTQDAKWTKWWTKFIEMRDKKRPTTGTRP